MPSTLKLAGALDRLAGVVLGGFTHCTPGEGFGSLTLDEVFDDYFLPLHVPVYRGAMLGHIRASSRCRSGSRCRWMPTPARCSCCSRPSSEGRRSLSRHGGSPP